MNLTTEQKDIIEALNILVNNPRELILKSLIASGIKKVKKEYSELPNELKIIINEILNKHDSKYKNSQG